jgi:hypothetical protein
MDLKTTQTALYDRYRVITDWIAGHPSATFWIAVVTAVAIFVVR